MAEKKNYKKTLITCYIGFITQAIVANFTPLLFLRFHNEYNIPLGEIALISTVFYVTQIVVDTLCATIVDRIGYRKSVVISQFLAGVGLVGLATLPNLLSNPFAGILISVIVYAMGSGMIEVLVSPIVEACPFEHKEHEPAGTDEQGETKGTLNESIWAFLARILTKRVKSS